MVSHSEKVRIGIGLQRLLQAPANRRALRPSPQRRIIVANPVLVQPRARIEVATGILPGIVDPTQLLRIEHIPIRIVIVAVDFAAGAIGHAHDGA